MIFFQIRDFGAKFFQTFFEPRPSLEGAKNGRPKALRDFGPFFDPNRLGDAKFADLFLENESAPLHERCAFVFQTLL